MRVSVCVLLAGLVCTGTEAATITSSATCHPPGGSPVTGSFGCISANGGVAASVNATYAIPGNSASPLTAKISGMGFESRLGGGYAEAFISLNLELSTTGPIRTGVANLFILAEHGPIPAGFGTVSSFVGPYSVPSCLPEASCGILNPALPFQLGTPFNVSLNGTLITNPNPASIGGQNFTVQVSLALRESNGLPVQILEIPEPSLLSASGFGLLGILLFLRANRACRSSSGN
jgi:hypothetical protein